MNTEHAFLRLIRRTLLDARSRHLRVPMLLSLTPALLTPVGSAVAASGDLDPTFGSGGRVSIDLGDQPTADYSLIQQADGKLVLATTIYDSTYAQRWLARLKTDGTLDASFGNGGIAIGAQEEETAKVVIQQADGKLVVAGNAWSNGYDIALWRFDSRGAADASFGSGGTAILDLGAFESASGLVQEAGGKLVIAGVKETEAGQDLIVARFNKDGSLDTAFGSAGTLIVDFPDGIWETTSLIRQPDGRLLVTGHMAGGVSAVRIKSDGVLDESFGVGGRMELAAAAMNPAHSSTWNGSAALQADGRIVIVGIVGHYVCCDPWGDYKVFKDGFVLRLQSDGTLDHTFGNRGILIRGTEDFASVALQADGKIVAAFDDFLDTGLTRFNLDGSADGSFGVAGTSVADFGSQAQLPVYFADALIRQSDGKFVIVAAHAVANGPGWNPAIARFGATDTGFRGLIGLIGSGGYGAEGSQALLNVRRTGGSTGIVSVAYETVNGSATGRSDYVPQTGRLEWADGDTSLKTISVELVDDADDEPTAPEQFRLRLDDVTGGAMLSMSEATISIEDNDPTPSSTPPPSFRQPSQRGGGGCVDALLLALLLLVLAKAHGFAHRVSRKAALVRAHNMKA